MWPRYRSSVVPSLWYVSSWYGHRYRHWTRHLILLRYQVACHYLSTRSADKFGRPLAKRQKDLASEIQSSALALVETGATNHHEILSLDLINNTMSSFIELKALTKDRRLDSDAVGCSSSFSIVTSCFCHFRNDETWLSPNQVVVQMMRKQIGNRTVLLNCYWYYHYYYYYLMELC